jgi:hypothetical protein
LPRLACWRRSSTRPSSAPGLSSRPPRALSTPGNPSGQDVTGGEEQGAIPPRQVCTDLRSARIQSRAYSECPVSECPGSEWALCRAVRRKEGSAGPMAQGAASTAQSQVRRLGLAELEEHGTRFLTVVFGNSSCPRVLAGRTVALSSASMDGSDPVHPARRSRLTPSGGRHV